MDTGALTHDECLLVATTFDQLAPIRGLFGELVHRQWTVLTPEIAGLLGDDADHHRVMLIEVLVNVIPSLRDGRPREEALRILGRWHQRRGIECRHYRALQEALLWALRQTLGEFASADALRAWRIHFSALCDRMLAAGAEERLALTVH